MHFYRFTPRLLPSIALLMAVGLSSCGAPKTPMRIPDPPAPTVAEPCRPADPSHQVFQVFIDSKNAGAEVRSTHQVQGPFGEELLSLSHLIIRVAAGGFDFDHHTIRAERVLAKDGTLLRGSFVEKENFVFTVSEVGFNGAGWSRIDREKRSAATDPVRTNPTSLHLTGEEIIGLRLLDHLGKVALGELPHDGPIRFYHPGLEEPIAVSFSSPEPGVLDTPSGGIPGTWITAYHSDRKRVYVRVFFDVSGLPLEEQYPAAHQVKRLVTTGLRFPTEFAGHQSGRLFSTAYLAELTKATRAVFRIQSVEGFEPGALAFLADAENQTLERKDDHALELTVVASSPDGEDPPTPKDTAQTTLIRPADPPIRDAARYLRSCGTAGELPDIRKENSARVMAKCSLIRKKGAFFDDPRKTASLVMDYVYALIPTKMHAPGGIPDAVTILYRGYGDCREHSVLFTSLMRSLGIPTRLISGMFLGAGGAWEPHLWAEYYDGHQWQQIDPANRVKTPSALYVAYRRGAPVFDDLYNDIAAFLDRTFSGVSFNLIDANANGENLLLSRPQPKGLEGAGTAYFNAISTAARGDNETALQMLRKVLSEEKSPVEHFLFEVQLLADADRCQEALTQVDALRQKTSAAANIFLLDRVELICATALGDSDRAVGTLSRMEKYLGAELPPFILLKAQYLYDAGSPQEGIALLGTALSSDLEDDPMILAAFARMVFQTTPPPGKRLLEQAAEALDDALLASMFTDSVALTALVYKYLREEKFTDALAIAEHALALTPLDPKATALVEQASAGCRHP